MPPANSGPSATRREAGRDHYRSTYSTYCTTAFRSENSGQILVEDETAHGTPFAPFLLPLSGTLSSHRCGSSRIVKLSGFGGVIVSRWPRCGSLFVKAVSLVLAIPGVSETGAIGAAVVVADRLQRLRIQESDYAVPLDLELRSARPMNITGSTRERPTGSPDYVGSRRLESTPTICPVASPRRYPRLRPAVAQPMKPLTDSDWP